MPITSEQSRIRLGTTDTLRRDFGSENLLIGTPVTPSTSGESSPPTPSEPAPASSVETPGARRRAADAEAASTGPRAPPLKPRYQRPHWKNLPKGATEFLKDGKSAMRLFKGGDIDTCMHELAHIAVHDLPEDDHAILEQHYADGKPISTGRSTRMRRTRATSRATSATGQAPTLELDGVFSKMSAVDHGRLEGREDPGPAAPPRGARRVRQPAGRARARRVHPAPAMVPRRLAHDEGDPARRHRDRRLHGPRIPISPRNELGLMRSGMLNDDPRQLIEHVNRVMMIEAQPAPRGRRPDPGPLQAGTCPT